MDGSPTCFERYKASVDEALDALAVAEMRDTEVSLQLALVHATLALAHATADISCELELK